jgi:serine/threonine protein kinase
MTWHGEPLPAPGSPAGPSPAGPLGAGEAPNSPVPAQRGAPGTVIGGRYALRTAIGHGGMGTVWRATDTVLRRDVAVKEVVLPPGLAPLDRDQMYQRTLREARAAAALSHPAVVQVYDVVTDVMELLNARSLAEMIVEDGPLAPRAVAKIGIALLGALEVAHAANVLHRDVKPANVLIANDGRCVLTDFGVARMPTDAELTSPGMVLGSPHFISPERAVGAKFGPPSDLFSLGVTLYTAVEGRPPFDKPDPFETMRAVVEEPPAPAMRAGALSGVLYGLLEKNPDRRWDVETARSVLRELMVGPLASNPTTHFTDPYAVVRPAPFTPPPAPTSSGQIGGRAMLAPGETVDDARRRRGDTPTTPQPIGPVSGLPGGSVSAGPARPAGPPAPPMQRRAAARDETSASIPVFDDTDAHGHGPTTGATGLHVDVLPRMGGVPTQPVGSPTEYTAGRLPGGRHARATGPEANRGTVGTAANTAVTAVAQVAGPGWQTFRRQPKGLQIGVAAGVALVLLLGLIGIIALLPGGSSGRMRAAGPPTQSSPAFATQEYHDSRGFVVNVPKDWTQRKPASGSYIDYLDPADNNRRIRFNIEATSGTPASFASVAEGYLKNNSGSCEAPYARVGLREGADVRLAGQNAAELEYKCGNGATARHGIWRFTVQGGKVYHFFLTVPDGKFADSKPIYDEMVRSYRLGG